MLARTRESLEFKTVRRSINALGNNQDSPLLSEARFRDAWRDLCAVYSEHSATTLEPFKRADHRIVRYSVFAYVLARVLGFLIMPTPKSLELEVAEDAAAIAAMKKLGPEMLRGFRALVKIPALHKRVESSVVVRCSTVPLTLSESSGDDASSSN